MAAAALAACADKSEQAQLDALRDGFAYKRYQQASRHGLPASYKAWQAGAKLARRPPPPDFDADTECMVHLALGYSALSGNKTTVAIAEADLLDQLPACSDLAQVAAALRSVAFHRLGWPGLAEAQSEYAWRTGAATPEQARDQFTQALVMHVVLGYAAAMDGRWDRAQVHADAIALTLGQPWLGELVRAAAAIQGGDVRGGLVVLKRLSENPQVPEDARATIAGLIAKVEAETGNVDSKFWLARAIAVLLWQEVRQHGPQGLSQLMQFADEQAARMDGAVDAGKQAAQGWMDRARRWLSEAR